MVEFYTEKKISVPEGCNVTIKDKVLSIECNGKRVTRNFSHLVLIMDVHEGHIRLRLWNARRQERSKLITCASHIKNMILGVTKGYEYVLKAAYVHFPISFDIVDNGKKLVVKNYLGEKSSRHFNMRGDSVACLGTDKDTVVISGTCIEDVSQSAGSVQDNCRPKNFDSRKFMDGIYISRRSVVGE
ncbi:hypothetical protein VCUG_01733 [Vavraia culicis subsp. floridensis]|uniref:Large ribosomal subunit protein uL6 alpha-beta domain-containing protein n=1 Tax=Vavraia culicis (isolate floridensis) TaxID=948595 RepID=L2GT14_VAVCU|nr:uncharacterized protein VCUG_01733 [Vavraia culicis subsp. floridensis]ELA46774.1 hypothetical protein VCUG_01733 [Vavraia culicis subsp. floridensis]